MPDCGERPAEEIERRVEAASCRDQPPNDYGTQLLQRSLPHQQPARGGRRAKGGIMRLPNYKGWTVNIRAPKWDDNQCWISCEDEKTAQYVADAMYYHFGRDPFHFPDAQLGYPPVRVHTGELLTTREMCAAYVAKIAKGAALFDQRKDYKARTQKLAYEDSKSSRAVQFLNGLCAGGSQVPHFDPSQGGNLVPAAVPEEEPEALVTGDGGEENETTMEVDSLRNDATQAVASTVTVNPSLGGNLVPVAISEEESQAPISGDGGEKNGTAMEVDRLRKEDTYAVASTATVNASQGDNLVPVAMPEETQDPITGDGWESIWPPMEVDSLSEEAIQALAPTMTVDPASLFQLGSSVTSSTEGFYLPTSYIAGFELTCNERENSLASAGQSLGVWHRRQSEKDKEDLVPDNYKEFLGCLDRGEEEIGKSIKPSDWEPWRPSPQFALQSPLLGRGTPFGVDADEERTSFSFWDRVSDPICVPTDGGPFGIQATI